MSKILHKKTFISSILSIVLTLISLSILIIFLVMLINSSTLKENNLGSAIGFVFVVIVCICVAPFLLFFFIKDLIFSIKLIKNSKNFDITKTKTPNVMLIFFIISFIIFAVCTIIIIVNNSFMESLALVILFFFYITINLIATVLALIDKKSNLIKN